MTLRQPENIFIVDKYNHFANAAEMCSANKPHQQTPDYYGKDKE